MYFIDERKKKFNEAKKKLNEARRIQRFMGKPEVAKAINQMYEDFLAEYKSVVEGTEFDLQEGVDGFNIDIDSFNDNTIILKAPSIGYIVDYELIADKINSVGFNTRVLWKIEKETYIGKYTLVLSDFLAAELPDEEIAILSKLGKIHDHVSPPPPPPMVTRSIYCEFG